MAAIPESAKLFMSGLIERARKLKKTIAFPEGTDPRVLEAAARLAREGVVRPVLIGARPAKARMDSNSSRSAMPTMSRSGSMRTSRRAKSV